ncbi:hypothetical protein CA54_21630 [Symmachiella macrocystis]|uniref:Uncharacterized protein n=1 Tax=Symmachiella macrocystis TaxID=2527985 RepID=A0A5C6BMN8_9PLAN|nr:hypothetical protein [Symmachiella macrocystis]TWU13328.1 hypothetical protein CA54_21630 [Symmachiella macrocystis]
MSDQRTNLVVIDHDKINGANTGFVIEISGPIDEHSGIELHTMGNTMRSGQIEISGSRLQIFSHLHCAFSKFRFWSPKFAHHTIVRGQEYVKEIITEDD